MNTIRFGLTTLGLACVLLAGGQKSTDEARAIDDLEVLIPAGQTSSPRKLHFEMFLEGKSVGYTTMAIAPLKNHAGLLSLSVDMVVQMQGGVRIVGRVTAKLNETFEPREVELHRTLILPNGAQRETTARVEIKADHMTVVRGIVGEGDPTTQRLPLPKSPFVFGVEMMIGLMDVRAHPSFVLRELDPLEGKITVQRFKAVWNAKGRCDLVSHKPSGEVTYRFELDPDGRVVGWSESPGSLTARRCSEERAQMLRKQFDPR